MVKIRTNQNTIRVVITSVLMLFVLSVFAQNTYFLYVGDRQLLTAPEPPTGAIYQTSWGSSGINLEVSKSGIYSAYVKVTDYFVDTEQVQCDYYWRWYDSSGHMYTNHATTYYSIKCNPVIITPTPSSMTLALGEGKQINYSVSPSTFAQSTNVQFISENTNITQVNSSGYVKAIGSGTTNIVLKNSKGPNVSCSVTVHSSQPNGVTLTSEASVGIEQSITLTPTVTPSGASTTFTWWTDDATIATVSPSGVVTGVSEGITRIWVQTDKGGYKSFCSVSVFVPTLDFKSSNPQNNQINVSCNTKPFVSFSTEINKGSNFENICLTKSKNRNNVLGTISINERTISFNPEKELESNMEYSFVIPANALQNKWGKYNQDIKINFKTVTRSKDIKYLLIWDKNGIMASLPLDGIPSITFDESKGIVSCKSSTQEFEFNIDEVQKYTLDTTTEFESSIKKLRENNPELIVQPNVFIITGCTPDTNIALYSIKGEEIKKCKSDANGIVILSKQTIPQGISIIKIGTVSYKIYIK